MKEKFTQIFFLMCIVVAGLLLAGFARQAQAVMPKPELTGTVVRKIRSAESAQTRYTEPGNLATRADRATAIIVDGNRMFILPETIVKRKDGVVINFDEVAVPCEAKLVYQKLPNRGRNVLEMHILSESAGASKKWAAPEPQ